MFDSREYSFADITVNVGGKDIGGLLAVKFKESQEKKHVYGKGNKPKTIQRGNIKYEGEISMLQSDFAALEVSSKNNSVLNLRFDVAVLFGDVTKGDIMTTYILQGAEITDCEVAMKQGDSNAEITLPIIFIDKITV